MVQKKIVKSIGFIVLIGIFLYVFTTNLRPIIVEQEYIEGQDIISVTEGEITLGQEFEVTNKKLTGIAVQFGTYMRQNEGYIQFNLYNNKGNIVANKRISKKNLVDNGFYEWYFPPIISAGGKDFKLEIILEDNGAENQVALYKNNNTENNQMKISINGKEEKGILNFKIYSMK